MFTNFKNKTKKISIGKKIKNIFFSTNLTFVFDQKLFISLFSQINILHKLYSYARYEMAYHRKKFKKIRIKTLTITACPYFKN